MSVSKYPALAALIGARFGGDGVQLIVLPNLNGRIPVGVANASDSPAPSVTLGGQIGTASVVLTSEQGASHQHSFNANFATSGLTGLTGEAGANQTSMINRPITRTDKVVDAYEITPAGEQPYNALPLGALVSQTFGNNNGGVDPHDNLQPYLALNYYICCLDGAWPIRQN